MKSVTELSQTTRAEQALYRLDAISYIARNLAVSAMYLAVGAAALIVAWNL